MRYVDIGASFESPTDKTPLVVFPGWSITLKTEEQLLECLTTGQEGTDAKPLYGRRVVAGEFPRWGGKVEKQPDIPSEVMRRAELVAQLILSQEGKVDVSVESMAGMDLVAAIGLHPELLDKIRNIVGTSIAGFSGNDNTVKLMGRSLFHFIQDGLTFAKSPSSKKYPVETKSPIERRNIIKMGIEASLYVLKNPVRTMREVNAIGNSEQYEGLKGLKKVLDEHGIRLAFIQAESDKLTPAAKLWEKIGEGAPSPMITLTQEMYEQDYDRYDELLLKPGDKVFDRALNNESPPFDFITMIGGGHDNRIYAQKDFGIKILRALEQLENPIGAEQATDFAKSEADIAQAKRYKKIEELAQSG